MNIKQLQRELLLISRFYQTTSVYPSGEWDQNTSKAINEVKALIGYKKEEADVTGKISDLARSLDSENRAHRPRVFDWGRVYAAGDRADAVAVGQIMINRIASKYLNVPAVTVNGIMDAGTVKAVGALRKIFGNSGAQLDVKTWRELAALYYSVRSSQY